MTSASGRWGRPEMSGARGIGVGRLTRRGRRRLGVVALAAAAGLTVPLWVPRMLSALPAFRVERVQVVGTQYVAPNEVVDLAAVAEEASVWDDPTAWEERVETHPMVREAHVRREGLHAVEIRVVEKRPVALVATPELLAVSAEGRILPLEPWRSGVDLPLIGGAATVEDGVVQDPGVRELGAVLERLHAQDPAFLEQVSEVRRAGASYEFLMLPGAQAGEVILPAAAPGLALRRVALALGQTGDARVARADARYARQVVLTLEATP